MEVTKNDIPLSQQVDYKKLKSDWDVFNHQEDYDFKNNKFCSGVAKFAKRIKTLNEIQSLQNEINREL